MPPRFFSSDHTPVLIAVAILLITGFIFWQMATAAIIALSMAIVLMPVQDQLKTRMNPGHAAMIICTLVVCGILSFIIILVNLFITQGQYLMIMGRQISESFQRSDIQNTLASLEPTGLIISSGDGIITRVFNDSIPQITDAIKDIAINIPGLIIQIFILFLILYLVLINGKKVDQQILDLFSHTNKEKLSAFRTVITDTMYAVYVVNIRIALLTIIITLPFFWILDYGNPFFWAFVCGASHLFPFFLPQLIVIFLFVYALAIGDLKGAVLILCIGYPLITGFADFWIRPKLMATKIAIHPALMMIGLFGGMLILGPIGLIIGPLIVALADAAFRLIVYPVSEPSS